MYTLLCRNSTGYRNPCGFTHLVSAQSRNLFGEIMALVVCTMCGHRISSLARFCPKCNHSKGASVHITPPPVHQTVLEAGAPEMPAISDDVPRSSIASCDELLQREFLPSKDETIILEGRVFLIKGILNVADCYAYLTSKRYVVCDSSAVQILFQISSNGFTSVEDGRHVLSRKIIITTVSGETYQVKCLPHYTWFGALLDPQGALEASRRPKAAPSVESAGTLDWFYESDGATVGPVHEKEMVQLIKSSSTVFRDTRVWNKSLPEWKRAEETILSIFFTDSHGSRTANARTTSGLFGRLWPHIQLLGRKYF